MKRDAVYAARQKERGYSKICVYVPTSDADRLKKYATKLRKAALKAKEQA